MDKKLGEPPFTEEEVRQKLYVLGLTSLKFSSRGILNEFQKRFGYRVPFESYGFRSSDAFLRSVSKIIEVHDPAGVRFRSIPIPRFYIRPAEVMWGEQEKVPEVSPPNSIAPSITYDPNKVKKEEPDSSFEETSSVEILSSSDDDSDDEGRDRKKTPSVQESVKSPLSKSNPASFSKKTPSVQESVKSPLSKSNPASFSSGRTESQPSMRNKQTRAARNAEMQGSSAQTDSMKDSTAKKDWPVFTIDSDSDEDMEEVVDQKIVQDGVNNYATGPNPTNAPKQMSDESPDEIQEDEEPPILEAAMDVQGENQEDSDFSEEKTVQEYGNNNATEPNSTDALKQKSDESPDGIQKDEEPPSLETAMEVQGENQEDSVSSGEKTVQEHGNNNATGPNPTDAPKQKTDESPDELQKHEEHPNLEAAMEVQEKDNMDSDSSKEKTVQEDTATEHNPTDAPKQKTDESPDEIQKDEEPPNLEAVMQVQGKDQVDSDFSEEKIVQEDVSRTNRATEAPLDVQKQMNDSSNGTPMEDEAMEVQDNDQVDYDSEEGWTDGENEMPCSSKKMTKRRAPLLPRGFRSNGNDEGGRGEDLEKQKEEVVGSSSGEEVAQSAVKMEMEQNNGVKEAAITDQEIAEIMSLLSVNLRNERGGRSEGSEKQMEEEVVGSSSGEEVAQSAIAKEMEQSEVIGIEGGGRSEGSEKQKDEVVGSSSGEEVAQSAVAKEKEQGTAQEREESVVDTLVKLVYSVSPIEKTSNDDVSKNPTDVPINAQKWMNYHNLDVPDDVAEEVEPPVPDEQRDMERLRQVSMKRYVSAKKTNQGNVSRSNDDTNAPPESLNLEPPIPDEVEVQKAYDPVVDAEEVEPPIAEDQEKEEADMETAEEAQDSVSTTENTAEDDVSKNAAEVPIGVLNQETNNTDVVSDAGATEREVEPQMAEDREPDDAEMDSVTSTEKTTQDVNSSATEIQKQETKQETVSEEGEKKVESPIAGDQEQEEADMETTEEAQDSASSTEKTTEDDVSKSATEAPICVQNQETNNTDVVSDVGATEEAKPAEVEKDYVASTEKTTQDVSSTATDVPNQMTNDSNVVSEEGAKEVEPPMPEDQEQEEVEKETTEVTQDSVSNEKTTQDVNSSATEVQKQETKDSIVVSEEGAKEVEPEDQEHADVEKAITEEAQDSVSTTEKTAHEDVRSASGEVEEVAFKVPNGTPVLLPEEKELEPSSPDEVTLEATEETREESVTSTEKTTHDVSKSAMKAPTEVEMQKTYDPIVDTEELEPPVPDDQEPDEVAMGITEKAQDSFSSTEATAVPTLPCESNPPKSFEEDERTAPIRRFLSAVGYEVPVTFEQIPTMSLRSASLLRPETMAKMIEERTRKKNWTVPAEGITAIGDESTRHQEKRQLLLVDGTKRHTVVHWDVTTPKVNEDILLPVVVVWLPETSFNAIANAEPSAENRNSSVVALLCALFCFRTEDYLEEHFQVEALRNLVLKRYEDVTEENIMHHFDKVADTLEYIVTEELVRNYAQTICLPKKLFDLAFNFMQLNHEKEKNLPNPQTCIGERLFALLSKLAHLNFDRAEEFVVRWIESLSREHGSIRPREAVQELKAEWLFKDFESEEALGILHEVFGPTTEFTEGDLELIEKEKASAAKKKNPVEVGVGLVANLMDPEEAGISVGIENESIITNETVMENVLEMEVSSTTNESADRPSIIDLEGAAPNPVVGLPMTSNPAPQHLIYHVEHLASQPQAQEAEKMLVAKDVGGEQAGELSAAAEVAEPSTAILEGRIPTAKGAEKNAEEAPAKEKEAGEKGRNCDDVEEGGNKMKNLVINEDPMVEDHQVVKATDTAPEVPVAAAEDEESSTKKKRKTVASEEQRSAYGDEQGGAKKKKRDSGEVSVGGGDDESSGKKRDVGEKTEKESHKKKKAQKRRHVNDEDDEEEVDGPSQKRFVSIDSYVSLLTVTLKLAQKDGHDIDDLADKITQVIADEINKE